jgi:hypothetical protein
MKVEKVKQKFPPLGARSRDASGSKQGGIGPIRKEENLPYRNT